MKNYVCIDIGGTKTRLVIFNSDRRIVFEDECTGVGAVKDSCDDIPEYRGLLERAAKYLPVSVAVNLGGRNREQIRKITSSVFEEARVAVFRESEGEVPLAFAEIHGGSVALLAGTGTIAAVREGEKKCIVGGWGMNIGDGGSGYDIGLRAIRKTLSALDGTSPLTALEKEICGLDRPFSLVEDPRCICDARDGVRERIKPFDRRAVAAVSRIAAEHAAAGEADAKALFEDAGRSMGEVVISCLAKLQNADSAVVCVTGGLLKSRALWCDAFEEAVRREYENVGFCYDENGIINGALALAVKLSEE